MRKYTYDKSIITPDVVQSLVDKGFTRRQIAEKLGVSFESIRSACNDLKIAFPKRGAGRKGFYNVSEAYKESHQDQFSKFLELHNQGMTFTQIAKVCGCSLSQVGKLFTIYGYSFDTAYKTKAAHEAIKGTKRTLEDLEKRALGKEKNPPAMSRWEVLFSEWLSDQSLPFTYSKAIGKYNVDFAIGSTVAVELYGGTFHSMGRAADRLHERMKFLINSGWNVYIIWCLSNESTIFPGCFDDFLTFYNFTSGDESEGGQYRVVWSDGDFVSAGSFESDYLSAITPPAFRHNALSKYRSPGN